MKKEAPGCVNPKMDGRTGAAIAVEAQLMVAFHKSTSYFLSLVCSGQIHGTKLSS